MLFFNTEIHTNSQILKSKFVLIKQYKIIEKNAYKIKFMQISVFLLTCQPIESLV